jgi:hypothetical protein
MDFAAQLAKLERQAAYVAAKSGATEGGNNNNQNPSDGANPGPMQDSRRRDRSPHNNQYNNDDDGRAISRRRYDYNQSTSNQSHFDRRNQGHNRYNPQQQQQHHRRSGPFQDLQNCGYRIRPSPWVPKVDRSKPHICLMAITIDELPYEHIWKAWATTKNSSCYVSLVCHAKYPYKVQSKWLQQRLLVQPPQIGRGTTIADPIYHTHTPEWGSIDITRGMIDCLKDAVQIGVTKSFNIDPRFSPSRYVISPIQDDDKNSDDLSIGNDALLSTNTVNTIPTVDKFIFISESCLPVMTLDEYVQFLFQENPAPIDKNITCNDKTNVSAKSITDKETVETTVDSAVSDDTTAITNETIVKELSPRNVTIDPWDVSWVNARNRNTPGTPKNMYESNQLQNIDRIIPDMCRYKSDQWILLSRRHAIAILHIDEHIANPQHQLWTLFRKISASDEMYFPTALGILGIIKDDDETTEGKIASNGNLVDISTPVLKRPVTYTDWSQGMRNPTSYTNGIRDFERVARIARKQKCFVARKFIVDNQIKNDPPGVQQPTTTNAKFEPASQNSLLNDSGQIDVDEWLNVLQKLSMNNGE